MRYIQYARRSSEERSHKQLQSIQGQEGDLDRMALEMGLEVTEKLEESRTAKEPGRPIFNYMIERLKRGEADAILCWHLDRLTRNEIDSGTIRWLLRKGVIKEIRTPHRVYLPADSLLITAVESAIGEQWIVDHTHKVDRGMLQKCANGGIPFRAPQGYLNNRITKQVETDPERFPLIQRVFRAVLDHHCSVAEAHRLLHEEWGYRKRSYGNSPTHVLSVNAMHALLSNTFYAGYFTWRNEVYTHNLPRAVTPEQFDQVQQIIRGKRHKEARRHVFPYAGLLACATCGFRVTAELSKGHTYYHCNNRLGICTKRGIREEELETRIDALLESITLHPDFETLALEILDGMRQEEAGSQQTIFESQQGAVAEVKRQKDALLGLFLQGHLTEEEFGIKKTELSKQEAVLNLKCERSEESLDDSYQVVENVAHFVIHAESLFRLGNPASKRFVAAHLGEYTLNNGELTIELNPIFEPVRSRFKNLPLKTEKIEPLKTGSLNLQMDHFVVKNEVWQSTLSEYRNLARASKWELPRLPAGNNDSIMAKAA